MFGQKERILKKDPQCASADCVDTSIEDLMCHQRA